MAQKHLEELSRFRGIVEFQINYIESIALPLLKNSKHRDYHNKVNRYWLAIQQEFLGKFENTRKKIYREVKVGKYSISAKDWLALSTKAIDEVLKF